MRTAEEQSPKPNTMDGFANKNGDETLSRFFDELKPLCSNLLDILQNPQKDGAALMAMGDFLQRAPVEGLQACLDYTMLPLLLLLDAAIRCRSQQSKEKIGMFNRPYMISDRVAEGVLLCLEELLKRCHLRSVDQMVVVLKKLTSGALLSPSEAAEEFRERIIKCFRSLLLGLRSCSVDSCICKNVPGLPFFTMGISLEGQVIAAPKIFCSESEECLLAFLLSENASAAVGHWLSLLLQAAETEAGRGHHGSARLRTEAFLTIRVLIAKVGTADALAFFLPGVVSHFAKVLHVSKTMISGAAGSVESIDHAIKGLTEFLMIVFGDEANRFGLGVLVDDLSRTHSSKGNSAQSFLEALRSLPKSQDHDGTRVAKESSIDETICTVPSKFDVKERNAGVVCQMAPLRVSRTKDWIETTSEHVDKLLSATFPHLCVHPSTKVRLGLVDSIRGLCTNCTCTLRKSKLMLLECFFVLVFDDLEVVAVSAQESLDYLFTLGEEYIKENEIAQIFSRLIEKLPRVMLGGKETIATSHTQGLLAAMYYAGPRRVVDHLLRSHVMAARFMDFLALSLSHNSVFAGSVDNLMLAKPHSVGYLHSIAELKAETCPTSSDYTMITTDPVAVSKISGSQDKHSQDPLKISCSEHELPRMPPWFVHIGGQKLYQALAGILRLLGLSIMADCRSEVSLSVLIDLPLEHIQKLISELRMKQYSKESWKSWYTRSDSGPLLRQASSAVCVLNEIIYGISDQSLVLYTKLFRKSKRNEQKIRVKEVETADQLENLGNKNTVFPESVWKVCPGGEARHHVIDCVRGILHEYLSPEVWDLPRDNISSLSSQDMDVEDLTFHFLRDVAMFHQVIIDGLGIFSLSLGKNFENSGFLHASLYLLLENLISMSYQVGSASDAVLRLLSSSSGHATVGRLVVSNADYIIDSLCRQLRHLDINPNVPNVLAAMLSYIGVAHEILPLLEEPLRSVSLELEVLGRHQHPNLTIPFLKAVREISKASRHESCTMPNEAQAYHAQVKSYAMSIEKAVVSNDVDGSDTCLLESGHWEEMLFKLDESKRYRRSVGSVAGSCLTAVIPLLSSTKEAACMVALDIIEDGVATLEKVEEAYGHEKETKEEILNVVKLCSFHDLQDVMDTADGVDENRLLPAMNKIWPYLVLCLKHKSQLVIRRCLSVVSSVVQICGGDFFIRRFHTDGAVFWKLLATSPFRRKPTSESESLILLPYRNTSKSHDDSMAEVSSRKTQEAVLNTIAEISRNKRSATALGGVFNKVSGLVVGIACSRSMASLNSACVNALCGLASIDPDFVWLLLADVVYSLGGNVRPPPTSDLAEVSELLPPPLSAKEFLYVKYGGEGVGVDVEVGLAEKVYRKLLSQVFTSQMY